ncbi:MAG: ATP-binding protein, partial [Haloechinothrix sp.]
MADGVDLGSHPEWGELSARTLDDLTGVSVYERRHYLTARLPEEGGIQGLRAVLGSAGAQVGERFGLPPARVRRRESEARSRQAAQMESLLRAHLELRTATAGEIRWLYARAARRGIDEPFLDESWEPRIRSNGEGGDARLAGPLLSSLTDAVFKEGGSREDPDRPRHRRYLRVETHAGVSYQTFLALADMPARFSFPGGAGEWFFHADELAFPVDWCARIRVVRNQEAQVKARRQARQLAAQVDEYEGEPSGVPQSLREAWEGVDEERAELSGNPADPELQATVVFCTWADNLPDLEEQAALLQGLYEPNEYTLPRPTGAQLELFRAMLPGATAPPVARDYAQFLLPRDLAAGMPFGGSGVGDPRGMLLGVTLDGGTFRPVLFDPAYGPATNRSGSIGVCGALGSGKSYFIKNLAWATIARGGQVVALDRTPAGEYVAFAEVVPGRAQVVRLAADADVCLDPLKVFPGEAGVRYAVGFLTLLTGTAPTDLEGAELAE